MLQTFFRGRTITLSRRGRGRPAAFIWERSDDSSSRFTPAGRRLVTGVDIGRVWDLRRVRAELARPGLAWGAPPYPPAAQEKDAAPLRLTVDLVELAPK